MMQGVGHATMQERKRGLCGRCDAGHTASL